jgi:tetratricopeptide (TPR) repeat protein
VLAKKAMNWFEVGMRLNRWDPYNYLRYGMCLDWLERQGEALPYFEKALELDPNGHFIIAHMGWHYVQVDDYATATDWFRRSLTLYNNYNNRNPMPVAYLDIIARRLAESTNAAPSGQPRLD